ncbi:hypothetical protein L596_015279 [Steinernema carpocapsae]|uniref:Uncharacterized protein n=1 Tax=Steinernema carpocapsae TaxID=34508 RepID=A0A4U5NEJ0_STECR|nr:hypothetical protein L596_015279 [Steinernema carpocapsae]
MGRCCRAVPFWSVVATIATVMGTVLFCYLVDKGIHGFLFQLGAFSTTISQTKWHWEIVLVGLLTSVLAILFLFIGMRSTLLSEYEEKFDSHRCCTLNLTVHPALMYFATLLGYVTVLVWIVLLCFAVTLAVLYMIFIGVMYTFCATIDNQCFDLSVLLPAIVKYVSNNKIDLTFCKDKKDAICQREHNQALVFLVAVVCGFVALIGLIHFLMCFSANLARMRLLRKARKGEHIAMNHGTVDSNSFIMTNMDK